MPTSSHSRLSSVPTCCSGDISEVVSLAAEGKSTTAARSCSVRFPRCWRIRLENDWSLPRSFPGRAIAEDKYTVSAPRCTSKVLALDFILARFIDYRISRTGVDVSQDLFAILFWMVKSLRGAMAAPCPFSALQPRLGRNEFDLFATADAPIIFMAFDILQYGIVCSKSR